MTLATFWKSIPRETPNSLAAFAFCRSCFRSFFDLEAEEEEEEEEDEGEESSSAAITMSYRPKKECVIDRKIRREQY